MMKIYRKRSSSAAIPIVPMIDILTILLIFFIVHTQWKKAQTVLKIDVPSTEYIQGEAADSSSLVLSIAADSSLMLDGKSVTWEELPSRLHTYAAQSPQRPLQWDMDKKATAETIVKVLDVLTSAGIDVSSVPARISAPQDVK